MMLRAKTLLIWATAADVLPFAAAPTVVEQDEYRQPIVWAVPRAEALWWDDGNGPVPQPTPAFDDDPAGPLVVWSGGTAVLLWWEDGQAPVPQVAAPLEDEQSGLLLVWSAGTQIPVWWDDGQQATPKALESDGWERPTVWAATTAVLPAWDDGQHPVLQPPPLDDDPGYQPRAYLTPWGRLVWWSAAEDSTFVVVTMAPVRATFHGGPLFRATLHGGPTYRATLHGEIIVRATYHGGPA